ATAAVGLWRRRPDYSSLFHTRRGSTHAPSRRRQDRNISSIGGKRELVITPQAKLAVMTQALAPSFGSAMSEIVLTPGDRSDGPRSSLRAEAVRSAWSSTLPAAR